MSDKVDASSEKQVERKKGVTGWISKNFGQSSNIVEQSLKTGQSSKKFGQSKNIGPSSNNTQQTSKSIAHSSKNFGQSSKKVGQSSKKAGQSSKNTEQSSNDSGQSSKNIGQSSKKVEQSAKNIGQSSKKVGQSSKKAKQYSKNIGQSSTQKSGLFSRATPVSSHPVSASLTNEHNGDKHSSSEPSVTSSEVVRRTHLRSRREGAPRTRQYTDSASRQIFVLNEVRGLRFRKKSVHLSVSDDNSLTKEEKSRNTSRFGKRKYRTRSEILDYDMREVRDDDTNLAKDEVDSKSPDHKPPEDEPNEFGGLSAPPEILARGPRARRAYIEAARDGTKKVYRTRLMLVGQERVGKTSLKKALTGQGFDKNEAITDGVETNNSCEINIEVAKAHEKSWSIPVKTGKDTESNDDEYSKALADEIAKRLIISVPQEETTPKPASDETGGISLENRHTDPEPVAEVHATPTPPSSADVTMPNQMVSLVERMIKEQVRLKEAKEGPGSGDELSLSIWDFAGHDVYYTTHQIFLTWRAIYVLTFDLSRDLDSVVPLECRDEYYEAAKGSSTSELTCLQFISFWLSSIYAHAVAPSTVNHSNPRKAHQASPPIFIVGTHRDSVPGDEKEKAKKIEAIFKKIRKSIQKKPYECHVIPKYYAIENSLQDKDKELVALRKHIETVAAEEPYIGEKIPIRWLLFEQALADDKINFMSLEQTKELTRQVGIESERELTTMLNFYHDLGYIVYFGDGDEHQSELRDIVILNPQWLIDVFKQVITILEPAKRDGIVSDAWTRLEVDGVLEDRLIHHMWQGFLEQKGALCELMAKFDLVCEAPVELLHQGTMSDDESEMSGEEDDTSRKCYYVPSRLTPRCLPEEIGEIKAPLEFFVDFRGFLPEGLFHRLMTRSVRWLSERGDHQSVYLFYRHISLMADDDHQAIFEMLPPHEATIKVTVFRPVVADLGDDEGECKPEPPKASVVNQVMTFMTDSLASLRRHWAKRIQYDVCFSCPTCGKRKQLKKCLNKKTLHCGIHGISAVSVRSKFGIDTGGTDSGSESPIMCPKMKNILSDIYLADLAERIGAEWQMLGIRLGLNQADIDHITDDRTRSIDRILATLQLWRQRSSCRDTSKMADKLCSALCQCGRTDLADSIKEDVGKR